MEAGSVTQDVVLQSDNLGDVLKLVAKHFLRERGRFAYEA
jgi:hypothetical protein